MNLSIVVVLYNALPKDYVFDVNRFCEFEGNTGPYILYMMVRIKSILNKYSLKNHYDYGNEREFHFNGSR